MAPETLDAVEGRYLHSMPNSLVQTPQLIDTRPSQTGSKPSSKPSSRSSRPYTATSARKRSRSSCGKCTFPPLHPFLPSLPSFPSQLIPAPENLQYPPNHPPRIFIHDLLLRPHPDPARDNRLCRRWAEPGYLYAGIRRVGPEGESVSEGQGRGV